MCYVGPEDKLLTEDRRHEGNSLVRGSNITHVVRELVNKCFVIYLLFSCDVSGQHCVAGPTSICVDGQHCAVQEHLNFLTFYYIELYRG